MLLLALLIFSSGFFNGCATKQRALNTIKSGTSKEAGPDETKKDTKKKKGKVVWVQRPEAESIISSAAKKDTDYLMNFDNITVPDFIETMMSGVFKRNYLITEAVKAIPARLTVKMTEDLKTEDAFRLFEKILAMYNVGIETSQNTTIFKADKSGKPIVTLRGPMVYGRKLPEKMHFNSSDEVTFLVPFYNISPAALKPVLQKQLPSRTVVHPIEELSLLVVNGNYADIKYTLSFIDLLDRVQFKEKNILMITPEYWDIEEFQEKVMELLSAEGIRLETVEKSRGLLFIPIGKLNSLVVISPNPEWVKRVLYWLDKLDVPEAAGEARKVYSYKLQNVEVEAVSNVLQSYLTGEEGPGGLNRGLPNRNPSSRSSSQKGKGAGKTASSGGKSTNPTSLRGRLSGGGGGSPIEGRDATVIPVLETNSLVIIASPVEYKKIRDIVRKIDVPRNQVFVEVIIGEVTLDKSTQLGLEFWMNRYLYGTRFGTKGGLGVYKGTDDSGGNLIPSGSNFFVDGTLEGTQFEVLINALVENSKINIISTPKITLVENVEAEISVGSEVPVVSQESGFNVNAGANYYPPVRSIQYVNTGIILKVKAAILSDNKIALDIEQEISEALENSKSTISSPEILKRTIKTTLMVNEGQIAFIGGMFQKKISTGASGIPVISKIPILGNLFKNSNKRLKKTELVVFINSKTLRRRSDMQEIVEEIKKTFSDEIYIEK